MICSHLVNLSLVLGAVLSNGIMWPLIGRLKGHWFSESLEESDMKSLYGYKVSLSLSITYIPIGFCYPCSSIYSVFSLQVFLSVALILGDGIYNFIKILACTIINIHGKFKNKDANMGNISSSL